MKKEILVEDQDADRQGEKEAPSKPQFSADWEDKLRAQRKE